MQAEAYVSVKDPGQCGIRIQWAVEELRKVNVLRKYKARKNEDRRERK